MKSSNIFKLLVIISAVLLCASVPASAQTRKEKEAARQLAEMKEHLQRLEAEIAELRGYPLETEEVVAEEEIVEEEVFCEEEEFFDESPAEEILEEEEIVEDELQEPDDGPFQSRVAAFSELVDIPYNDTLETCIRNYLDKYQWSAELWLYDSCVERLKDVFTSRDLPEDLSALALAESGMNPKAVSPAGYKGLWCMGYSVAKNHGLTVDTYVDERLDVLKSGAALADYISDAYAQLGDMALAIEAYNCGIGNVHRAVEKAGGKDFWSVYEYLPAETRDIVPEFIAALYVTHYSWRPKDVPEGSVLPEDAVPVTVSRKVHLQQVADVLGTSLESLQDLNLQYVRSIVPGDERACEILVPADLKDRFEARESEIPAYKPEPKKTVTEPDTTAKAEPVKTPEESAPVTESKPSTTTPAQQSQTYTVKSGDTLGKIADKYNVTVGQLKSWNGLKSDSIKVGQKLTVYGRGSAPATQTPSVTHTVKSGETLSKIASKYGTTVEKIKKLNGMTGDTIHVGQKIKVK